MRRQQLFAAALLLLLCDADHEGSAEVVIPYGRPGDEPLLGDPSGL